MALMFNSRADGAGKRFSLSRESGVTIDTPRITGPVLGVKPAAMFMTQELAGAAALGIATSPLWVDPSEMASMPWHKNPWTWVAVAAGVSALSVGIYLAKS